MQSINRQGYARTEDDSRQRVATELIGAEPEIAVRRNPPMQEVGLQRVRERQQSRAYGSGRQHDKPAGTEPECETEARAMPVDDSSRPRVYHTASAQLRTRAGTRSHRR